MSSNYSYKGISLSTVISSSNVIDDTSIVATNNYTGFPNKSNIAIDNTNFDTKVGDIGYKHSDTDLGNNIPAAVVFYIADLKRSAFNMTWGNTIQSDCTFYDSITRNVDIENCFNYISVIICGGGGGGGYSNSNGGRGGCGGGGGDCASFTKIDLSLVGRSFEVIVGRGGLPGIPPTYGTVKEATSGGASSFKSNTTGHSVNANGGHGGVSGSTNPTPVGNTVTNFLFNHYDSYEPGGNSGPLNFGKPSGGEGSYGVVGGQSGYTTMGGRNSGVLSLVNNTGNNTVLSNNLPGIPAGGDASNVTRNDNNAFYGITFNRPSHVYGSGGGGAGGTNGGNGGRPGGIGAPGFVIIYKYIN
jgi:hypothetical protein